MIGRLAVAAVPNGAIGQIYQVPDCRGAEINLNFVNTGAADAAIQVAVVDTASPTPGVNDFIEKGVVIPLGGGTLRINGLLLGKGEKIFVLSSVAGVVARVSGKILVNQV